jgi:hypothetical protein
LGGERGPSPGLVFCEDIVTFSFHYATVWSSHLRSVQCVENLLVMTCRTVRRWRIPTNAQTARASSGRL